ncbi:MAG: THUMP domain-containing class I SAM-dependent RNA methyltransferase [Kiritimatiellia bacterium]|jgi:23S rRNA (guanine2445-N2)-methyltransferase / 23S rRNA (guanine2069-N7)-methyltransferase
MNDDIDAFPPAGIPQPEARESDGIQDNSIWSEESLIKLSCARGLPVFAARDLKPLGPAVTEIADTTVTLRGTLRDAMRINLWSRIATRVLWRIGTGWARDLSALYDLVNRYPWERYLPKDGYFTVNNATRQETVRDTRLPSLCTKDAVADRIRAACGRRPDSGGEFKGAALFVWWQNDRVELYLDTTGEPLSKRGYRLQPWKAPMQETLAAACIAIAEWNPDTPFVAPMCGSGTPAIEAAMIAANRAPGILREHFCFMGLQGYADESIDKEWEAMRQQAVARERRTGLPPIVATDIAPEAIDAAKANAARAGVSDLIRFDACDFASTEIPQGRGVVFLNPEYGERMGEAARLVETYRRVGDFLKQRCAGYRGAVLTGNLDLARRIGLHSRKRHVLDNGPISCRLLLFDLYR